MEITVQLPSGADRVSVVGTLDRNLKLLREVLGVRVVARDGRVHLSGESSGVHAARHVLNALITAALSRTPLSNREVRDLIDEFEATKAHSRSGWRDDEAGRANGHANDAIHDDSPWHDRLNVYVGGKPVRARTPNQEAYLRAIRELDLVFALGPAGTGKTYLAVAAAVHLLRAGRAKRVVLTRPAVEAGEKLGYLPGDLREKVNPYLRPLFDALNDMMDYATARRFMENDVIEVCPLAFMRGRTLNHSVVILDEAQNATKSQLMMFLTRMGEGTKMIVTGDPSQTDLPDGSPSGLVDAAARLARTEGVGFVGFDANDVVRHPLVKRILAAYERDEKRVRGRRSSESSVVDSGPTAAAEDPDRPASAQHASS